MKYLITVLISIIILQSSLAQDDSKKSDEKEDKKEKVYDGDSLDEIYPNKEKRSFDEWTQSSPNENLPGIK
ncbi:MAG: hypothetical protein P8K14_05075 [Flavobacteriaceae bacterium]|nr:hypothetical protein [Flavobacteriaceae bacterium]